MITLRSVLQLAFHRYPLFTVGAAESLVLWIFSPWQYWTGFSSYLLLPRWAAFVPLALGVASVLLVRKPTNLTWVVKVLIAIYLILWIIYFVSYVADTLWFKLDVYPDRYYLVSNIFESLWYRLHGAGEELAIIDYFKAKQ